MIKRYDGNERRPRGPGTKSFFNSNLTVISLEMRAFRLGTKRRCRDALLDFFEVGPQSPRRSDTAFFVFLQASQDQAAEVFGNLGIELPWDLRASRFCA